MKLSSKGRYAVMALADIAHFNQNEPISLSEIGSLFLNLAMSAKAITAYLLLVDSFIFSAIHGLYIYLTNLVKFITDLKACFLSLNFGRKI